MMHSRSDPPIRWETYRGDEWWYTDSWCTLSAVFNSTYPGTLSITEMKFKAVPLSENRVHELLWSTHQQFKENKIEICSHRDLLPYLEALQRKGLLETKPINSAYSTCILLISVSPPKSKLESSATSSSKKQWWHIW